MGLSYGATSPFQVVIDPGHGGADHGAIYSQGRVHATEKDITLKLARQVARQLRIRGISVTLTRDTDREISLPARTALANRIGADVFLSIHMNSTADPQRKAHTEGVETFILNNTTDASSRRLARLENSVISLQSESSPQDLDVALILKDLRLDGNLRESKGLACQVQSHLVENTSRSGLEQKRDRGVKQALFHVLLGADMPSVLVEAGFITNAHDRSLVLSPRGQALIGKSIADAIEAYKIAKNSKRSDLALNKCKVH